MCSPEVESIGSLCSAEVESIRSLCSPEDPFAFQLGRPFLSKIDDILKKFTFSPNTVE